MALLGSSSFGSAPNDAVRLEDFIGEWRDSLGHQVRVRWAQQGNVAGELDVQLIRPRSNSRVRLNVKALGEGQFQCGHFKLKLDKSSVEKIVWGDMRIKGKVSVWEREVHQGRPRSRSRSHSPSQRRRNCGCVFMGKVALRCIEHPPLSPPRSVLHDISTPGAWAPPATAPEIVETEADRLLEAKREYGAQKTLELIQADRLLEANRLLEAYDQSLTHSAAELPQPQASPDALHDAEANLLVKHAQMPAVGEAEAKLLVPDMLANSQIRHSGIAEGGPKDPRLRRGGVAPTGGA